MIISIVSSAVVAGIVGYSYLKEGGGPVTNDAKKIQRIFANSKLTVNEEGKMKTVRLHRKRKIEGGMEYVYQLPLGMSFKQVEDHKNVIEDGLNVRPKMAFDLQDLFKLRLNKHIIRQIKEILSKKKKARKEIELDFDGMLRIRVYDEPMPDQINWSDDMLKGKGVPIGVTRSGMIFHDFDELPHLLIGGATGYGKSQTLKMMITALILKHPDVSFSLIDLKSGTSFARFQNCRQVKWLGKDPDEAKKILVDVQKAMNEKFDQIVGDEYEDVKEAGDKRRHFVIIDEAADISDDKEAMPIVKDIARRGRAAGFHLIYATQYPTTETVPSQVKRNIVARLAFIVDDAVASQVVLGQSGAEKLPEVKGRAIYKRLKQQVVQCPYMSNDTIKKKITPHIVMKARNDHDASGEERDKRGSDTLYIEPTGLS